MYISYPQLPAEVELDSAESSKMTNTISDVPEAYICDLITPSEEK